MCGAGVTYLLADYMGLMDDGIRVMAMLATIGDVMELKGFNVQLVRDGLRVVNERKYRNIEALGYDFSAPGGVNYFLSNDAEKRILFPRHFSWRVYPVPRFALRVTVEPTLASCLRT